MALEGGGPDIPESTRDDLDRITQLASSTEDMIRDLLGLFQIVSTPETPRAVNLSNLV